MAKYTTIEAIVESYLLKRGLTVHWYIEVLKHATDCYRELHFDTMNLSRFKLVDILEGNTIKYPCDYVDYVAVWKKGHVPGKTGNVLRVVKTDRRKELIYLDPNVDICDTQALMEYMTDGSDCDAASRVHPFSQKTIEEFITWKRSPNRDNPRSPEGSAYRIAEEELRGRLNDLSLEEIEYMMNNRGRLQRDWIDLLNDI